MPSNLSFDQPDWGWSELSPEPVDVRFVPGNHASMLREPHVDQLARELAASLVSPMYEGSYTVKLTEPVLARR